MDSLNLLFGFLLSYPPFLLELSNKLLVLSCDLYSWVMFLSSQKMGEGWQTLPSKDKYFSPLGKKA
jgi:hypothetical protein